MKIDRDVHGVPVLELDAPASPSRRGAAHGEHFRGRIGEHLAWLSEELGMLGSSLLACLEGDDVDRHAAALAEHAPDAREELDAIARAANVPFRQLLALEHLVAHRRTREEACPDASPDPRGSTLFHTFGPGGAVLALAWDAPEVARFGVLTSWTNDGSDALHGAAPSETLVFGLAGTLGAAAMSTSDAGGGRVVGSVELHGGPRPTGLGVGGTLRRLLRAESLAEADAWLRATPRMDSTYWGIADRDGYVGVESVYELAVRTHVGVHSSHVHTNHFFDPVLRRHERHPLPGASHRRMEAATTAFAQDRPRTFEAVRAWLWRHDRRVRAASAAAADLDVERSPYATMLVLSPGKPDVAPAPGEGEGASPLPAEGAGAAGVAPRLHLQRGLLR